MIVPLLIASLAVVLRITRQAGGKERTRHESTTMNELPKLITQHYEKNEAGGSSGLAFDVTADLDARITDSIYLWAIRVRKL
jgi:hypothetical protein